MTLGDEMKYTREQIEDCAHDLKEESANAENALFGSNDKAALMLRQLLAENEALREDAERWRYARDNCDMSLPDRKDIWFVTDSGHRINVNSWSVCENERAIDAARKEYP